MNQQAKSKGTIRRVTITGMMIAITLLMTYTPLGTIHVPPVSGTIAHLPTIILAIIEGPICGLIGGIALGLISMIFCLTTPVSPLDPFIANPLVSVLPRIFIGLASYFVYKGVLILLRGNRQDGTAKPVQNTISVVLGTAAGSIANTAGVLTMLYLVYKSDLMNAITAMNDAEGLATPANAVITLMVTIITTNGVSEVILITVLGSIVILALKRAGYGRKF